MSIRFLALAFGLCAALYNIHPAYAVVAPTKSIGSACHELGETLFDADQTTTIGCFKRINSQPNCGTEAAPTCTYKQMALPAGLVRVSFELVGAGGGGGGGDWMTNGGNGGMADVLRFDTYLSKGVQLTVSPGGAGFGGMGGALGKNLGDGGSALMGRGGDGGGTDGSNTPQVGPSGVGGGGGAASVVMGEGIFAVAAGGGGGGGGSYSVTGGAGNPAVGGALGMDGTDGLNGCNGRDGGGGGGGGGGYPGGRGGSYGCDYSVTSVGGNKGVSYLSLPNGSLPFSRVANNGGVGIGGAAGGSIANGGNGACGRVTIWSSTGARAQFDCAGVSPPMWIVQ